MLKELKIMLIITASVWIILIIIDSNTELFKQKALEPDPIVPEVNCSYHWDQRSQVCWAFCEKEIIRTRYHKRKCKQLEESNLNGLDN